MSAREITKHTIWNVLGQVAPLFIAIVALPILLRRLGLERYGFLTIVWVLVGYVGVFDLGVGRAVTRIVAERMGSGDAAGADRTARSALGFLLCVGSLLGLLLLLFAPVVVGLISLPELLKEEGVNAVRILALSLPLVLLTSGYRGYLEARRAFGALNLIRVGMGILTYLAPLLATVVSPRLESMVVSVLIMRFLANYAHRRACLAQPGASLAFERPSVAGLRPLLAFGGWITVSNVISPMMNSVDRLLIGPLVPIAAVGMYATGYDVVTKVLILAYSLTGAAFPMFAGLTDAAQARKLYATFLKVMLLSIWPVLFVISLFAPELFKIWLGAEFSAIAGPAVQILTVGLLFNCFAQMPAMLIQSRGSPKWMAVVHLAEVPIFLAVIYFLTKNFGVLGTAAAWSLRACIDSLIMFSIAARRLAPDAIPILLGIALFVLSPIGLLLPLIDMGVSLRLGIGLAVVCVFFGAVWSRLLTAVERAGMLQLIQNRFRKV